MQELVSKFLRFGSLLKLTIGLSLKIGPQSGLLLMIFQFLWIISLIFGLHGLKLATMTGVLIGDFSLTSRSSFCVNLEALL